MTSELIERVARIIDPSSWRVMDSEKASMLRKYKGKNVGWPSDQFQHKESMAKAQEIIAAMQADADLERIKRERDQAVEALKTADAWLDRWARHIGDCPGIDDCTCGLTRVRYEAITALAGDSHDNTIKCGTECPYSHDGFHHVDTSMESGPNNCFHCERPMP